MGIKMICTYALLAILTSCSPQKRMNLLLKKHPELKTVDTLTRYISYPMQVPCEQANKVLLKRWIRELCDGQISIADFEDLIKGQQDLKKYQNQ